MSELAHQAVQCLERRGLIKAELFEAIAEHAPGRQQEVKSVAVACGVHFITDAEYSITPQGLTRVDPTQEQSSSNPKRFFLGHPPSWGDLADNLDVRRKIIYNDATFQYQEFLNTIRHPSDLSNLLVIFGEGGSGKTTFLRRLMYDLSTDGNTVFRHQHDAPLDPGHIAQQTIQLNKSNKRQIYIFIDDAQHQAAKLLAISHELTYSNSNTTIIAAARRNEWNAATHRLRKAKTYDSIFLSRLDQAETYQLINNLAKNNALGKLEPLSPQQRIEEFTVKASNQLLVGLLEATQGKRFRDIVFDEFQGITNPEASALYLAICVFARLRLRTPDRVAVLISKSDSTFAFNNNVLPLLELVVSRENIRSGFELSPRHRIIADELIRQLCKGPGTILEICLNALERMSDVKRPEKRVQRFASKLGPRLLKRKLITQSEEAYKAVDLLLTAGVGDYRWGVPPKGHSLRRQSPTSRHTPRHERFYQTSSHAQPSQLQFRACVPILRQLTNDDEAILLINTGLDIDSRWSHLRLDWAIIEYERGNIERAEQIISDIITHQNNETGDISLPIALAVDIALIKKNSNNQTALTYLEFAKPHVQPGMFDTKQYFLHLSSQYEAVGLHDKAIDTLKWGLDILRGPKWAIESLERAMAYRLATLKPAEFYNWINKRYGERHDSLPYNVVKCQIEHALTTNNPEVIDRIWKTTSRGKEAIADTIRLYLEQKKIETVNFIADRIDLNDLPDNIIRLFIHTYIDSSDEMGLRKFATMGPRVIHILHVMTWEHATKGGTEAFQMLSRATDGGASKEASILALLNSATESTNAQALKESIQQLRELGTVSRSFAKAVFNKAINEKDRELASEVLHHVTDVRGLARDIRLTHLKGGDLSVLAFIDDTFGKQPLESWIVMLLLHSALINNDKSAAVDVCSRTTDLADVFSMLRKRLKNVESWHEEFLSDIANSVAELKKIDNRD